MTDTDRRKKVTREILEKEMVPLDVRNQCLQTALYNLTKVQPFLGTVLQSMDIDYSYQLPTAGIWFDGGNKKWVMHINPFFYCKALDDKAREAVLLHEIYHVVHKHPIRLPFMKLQPWQRKLMNIAMDMAINQFIVGLPKGCKQCPKDGPCTNELCPGRGVFVEDFYDLDEQGTKVPWPENKPTEFYYEKLLQRVSDDPSSQNDDGTVNTGAPGGDGVPVGEMDQHHWEDDGSELDKLDATEDLVRRALQKQDMSYSNAPGFVKDLLDEIEARRAELDYKGILLSAIKRSATGCDRKKTYVKPSRRYGFKAPGSKLGDLPSLECYFDTSGSFSVQEINDSMAIMDELLNVGARRCKVHLWHTRLYHSQQHKRGDQITKEVFQSGGTCLESTMKHIYENKPDLSIIFTDGYYCDVDFESMLRPGETFPQVLFIISIDGSKDHPLQRLGETVQVPKT